MGDKDTSKFSSDICEYNEIAGYGEELKYKNHTILAGNEKLLAKYSIPFDKTDEIGTIVYLAVDGRYVGYILLVDQIKDSSLPTISSLRNAGVKTIMLTGDKENSAKKVASTLKIDEVRYELLPEEKTAVLKETIDGNKKAVAYVGDGINDAPSITLADVGFAMGGVGSDLAVENANIVIMNDDISKVFTAIKIAKTTRNRAIFNVVASLLIKVAIALCSVFIPNFPLMIAVFADTGVTLLMVASSISLLIHKVK